jgi:decaprenylphospho-beta-D-erythro-pentofuranosid-2-ulose 2-reductase
MMDKGSGKNVIILGAGSGIAKGVARALAARQFNLILGGRDMEDLEVSGRDLAIRHGVRTFVEPFDAADFDSHPTFFDRCRALVEPGQIDGVVLCHGFMADQKEAERNFHLARKMVDVNFTSAISILGLAANYFEERGSGFIVGVSSVAGDRGRMSNYLYGSSKAGLSAFLSGLRARLQKRGVQVLTVKPGFVDTSMTWGLPGLFLVGDPDAVGESIARAIERRRNVLYTPWMWWGIMSIIRSVPEFVFKRTKI